MELHERGQEFYSVLINTDPPVAAWEASFDDGVTWIAGESSAGAWRWLVAGPLADAATLSIATRLSSGTTEPMVRALSNPEVVVREAPKITVYS